jgi:hypothetical protein
MGGKMVVGDLADGRRSAGRVNAGLLGGALLGQRIGLVEMTRARSSACLARASTSPNSRVRAERQDAPPAVRALLRAATDNSIKGEETRFYSCSGSQFPSVVQNRPKLPIRQ